jgi:hypothetical protein
VCICIDTHKHTHIYTQEWTCWTTEYVQFYWVMLSNFTNLYNLYSHEQHLRILLAPYLSQHVKLPEIIKLFLFMPIQWVWMISNCGLHLPCPDYLWCWEAFHTFIDFLDFPPFCSIFCQAFYKIVCNFLICRNSFIILDTKILWIICCKYIFPLCLFFLLHVY